MKASPTLFGRPLSPPELATLFALLDTFGVGGAKALARHRALSIHTVLTHLRRAFLKTGVHSQVGLIIWWFEKGRYE